MSSVFEASTAAGVDRGGSHQAAGMYPASAAQRRFWYMSQSAPNDPHYNVTMAIRLSIDLDTRALRDALKDLVSRHEILRTRYLLVEGEIWQSVLPPESWDLEYMGETPVSEDHRFEECTRLGEYVARLHIDLEKGPVFRAFLWRFCADDHLLVLLIHHAATDQRSINRIGIELEALYAARCMGETSKLLQPSQYREYVQYENERFARDRQRLISYWDRQLQARFQPLPLPYHVDQLSPGRDRRGREHYFELDAEKMSRFRQWCRQARMTEFGGLLCIWSVLLHAMTRAERLLIGTTTAFREEKFAAALGCFVNSMAIRIDISSQDTLSELLQRVKDQLLDAFEHRALTYERVVERARALGVTTDGELINAYLQFQPRSIALDTRCSSIFQPNVNTHNGRAKFPLMLNVSDAGDRLVCHVEYEEGAFLEQTIRVIADDFAALFAALPLMDNVSISSLQSLVATKPRALAMVLPSSEKRSPAGALSRSVEGRERPAAVEAKLSDIWNDLIRQRPGRPDDDFFSLGGHSLLLTQLIWRIQNDLGVRVRLKDIRAATGFADMVKLVHEAQHVGILEPATMPSAHSMHVSGISLRLELGTWSLESLNGLLRDLKQSSLPIGVRVFEAARHFAGTPVKLFAESHALSKDGVALSLGSFDSASLARTALAFSMATDLSTVIRGLQALLPGDNAPFADFDSYARWLDQMHAIFDSRARLQQLDPSTVPRTGDIAIFASLDHEAATSVDRDIGILVNEGGTIYIYQAIADYAISGGGEADSRSLSGIFYDAAQQCEQIGVGFRARRIPSAPIHTLSSLAAHGADPGTRTTLTEYIRERQYGLHALYRLIESEYVA